MINQKQRNMAGLFLIRLEIIYCGLLLAKFSQALICYECVNAKNDEECRRKGKAVRCSESQTSCQTTERIDYVQGPIVKITKQCKQARACHNNYKQNDYKKEPQCNFFDDISVCRCCCTEDYCNFDTDTCTGVMQKIYLKEANRTPRCPELTEFKNGIMACSSGIDVGSVCHFRCQTFHDLSGPGYIMCNTVKKRPIWTDKMPCCAKSCPPHGDMDLIFGVDSSFHSVGQWEKMKTFLKTLINKFNIGRADSKVGIVTFNEKVAEDREVFLAAHDNKLALTDAVEKLEYVEGHGYGIRTGQLLNHVMQNSFARKNGNREDKRDIFVLLTFESFMKEKSDPETVSKLMRDNGIQIITVGIGSSAELSHLSEIAGSPSKMINVRGGFDQLLEADYIDKVTQLICGDPCLRS